MRRERPAAATHTCVSLRPTSRFQTSGDLRYRRGYLINVLDLTVQHGTPLMRLFFDRQNMHAAVFLPAEHAYHAARSNVERINQLPFPA